MAIDELLDPSNVQLFVRRKLRHLCHAPRDRDASNTVAFVRN